MTGVAKKTSKKKSNPRDTPAMRQFARFKSEHPDCILLFRMGDFYETFDDDAVTAHEALGITLTERSPGVPMAGVPYHAVETYLARLIEQGFRVAVCEQIQDPKEAKGVVERAVTRVLTPGTLVDESLLQESASNQVAAIHRLGEGPGAAAVLASAELSTGRFDLCDVPAGRIIDEIVRLDPSELLVAESADGQEPMLIESLRESTGCLITPRPAWTFRLTDARDTLLEHYSVKRLDGFGLSDEDPAIPAAGALVRYFQETQTPDGEHKRLAHLRPPQRRVASEYLAIDANSLRSLEIERTMRSGRTDGSLLSVLQRCVTPMGKRLLRHWLCFPLRDLERIQGRQRCVSCLVEDDQLAQTLRDQLKRIQDVARIVGRVGVGRVTPRDLLALGTSIDALPELIELLSDRPPFALHHRQLVQRLEGLDDLGQTILQSVVEDPPAHAREGGIFRDGLDTQLDEVRTIHRDAKSWQQNYEQTLRDQTGIPSLKIKFNRAQGYGIEVTKTHTHKVPEDFQRKQTLTKAERYVTEPLREFQEKVTTAESRAIEREKKLFEQMCTSIATKSEDLAAFADLAAEIDVLGCFARTALSNGYVCPTMCAEPVLQIEQGRHPVLDQLLQKRFVPNDCTLGGPEAATLSLITGPNMAGKSTFIRQVALIVLLAHTGSFVPAARATIGLTDQMFTRIGAADELHTGQSTFMVEMTETANILHHATENSLVILDEIGRGTSTLDGLSLAWAIAETIAAKQPRALFATHYHELTSLGDRLSNVGNLHVAVREWEEEIVFLYRILPGRTDRSYGIHVAKIAGVPAPTIARARELLEGLVVQSQANTLEPAPPPPDQQMNLFKEYVSHPVLDEIKTLDLEQMTPMKAFDVLRSLVQLTRETP